MDPTYREMKAFMEATGVPAEAREYVEEGIYWFAAQYHGGQGTNLYAAMNECAFQPGPIAVMSSESVASSVFEMLEAEYCKPSSMQLRLLETGENLPEDKDLYS